MVLIFYFLLYSESEAKNWMFSKFLILTLGYKKSELLESIKSYIKIRIFKFQEQLILSDNSTFYTLKEKIKITIFHFLSTLHVKTISMHDNVRFSYFYVHKNMNIQDSGTVDTFR